MANCAVDELNRVKNPRLLNGAKAVSGWRWLGNGTAVSWQRQTPTDGDQPVMTLSSDQPNGSAGWARRVTCTSNTDYRIEAIVSGACQPASDRDGLILTVQPISDNQPAGPRQRLLAPPQLPQPVCLQAYYHVPPGVRSLELSITLQKANGWAQIHEVRVLEILDPEVISHVLAVPGPPYAYPPPCPVESICVCGQLGGTAQSGHAPSLAELLQTRFGKQAVSTTTRLDFDRTNVAADAVLLLDHQPPKAIRSLKALEELARHRIVIISLPAFAKLASQGVAVRTVEQADDSICAKVHSANFITVGLAIGDIFPYAWRSGDQWMITQRHLRRGRALSQLCRQRGYEIILKSECNTDATSGLPVCLFKPTEQGGVVVLDLEPIESPPSNFDEPNLAMYLLLNTLGVAQNAVGQYIVPDPSEKRLRGEIQEFSERFEAVEVRGDDHPDRPRRDQHVFIGAEKVSYGLPVPPRPLILIHTGLTGSDYDGVYGTLLYLKNLVRSGRFACPYALELIQRYRLAWVPLGASWHQAWGWSNLDDPEPLELPLSFDPSELAAVIEITSTQCRLVRLLVSEAKMHQRIADLLPPASHPLLGGRFFYRAVPDGQPLSRFAARTWQSQELVPHCVADDGSSFVSPYTRQAIAAGKPAIRLETPGTGPDFVANSIWRTDLVATLLEQLVALQYGWVMMNYQCQPQTIKPPTAALDHRQAKLMRIIDGQPTTNQLEFGPGQTVIIPPGAALCIPTRG